MTYLLIAFSFPSWVPVCLPVLLWCIFAVLPNFRTGIVVIPRPLLHSVSTLFCIKWYHIPRFFSIPPYFHWYYGPIVFVFQTVCPVRMQGDIKYLSLQFTQSPTTSRTNLRIWRSVSQVNMIKQSSFTGHELVAPRISIWSDTLSWHHWNTNFEEGKMIATISFSVPEGDIARENFLSTDFVRLSMTPNSRTRPCMYCCTFLTNNCTVDGTVFFPTSYGHNLLLSVPAVLGTLLSLTTY